MRSLALPFTLAVVQIACGDREAAPPRGKAYAKTVSQQESTSTAERPAFWDDYWYAGLAEVNTYDLTQERYGETREGEAVLVFVTEPFLPEAQVKDDGLPSEEEAVSVLKLNRIHRFTTGIYDYSLMLSAFTPVSRDRYPHTLKTTLSSQDWCGHSWFQLNLDGSDDDGAEYEAQRRSYFQAEADADGELEGVTLLEDELPALVRIDPELIPTGEVMAVPGAMFSALRHVMPEAQRAVVSVVSEDEVLAVSVDYPELRRTVSYDFMPAFPNLLRGWQESYQGEVLSRARLNVTRRSAYWGENATQYAPLRDSLGL